MNIKSVSRRSRKLATQCQTDLINIHTVSCARRSDWSAYAYTETAGAGRGAHAHRGAHTVRGAESRGAVSQIAGVWALKAGVTSRLRISISRREKSGTSWWVTVSGRMTSCSHTHIIDYSDWSDASSVLQLHTIDACIEFVYAQDARDESVTWHFSLSHQCHAGIMCARVCV